MADSLLRPEVPASTSTCPTGPPSETLAKHVLCILSYCTPRTSPGEQKGKHDHPRSNQNHPPRSAGPETAGPGVQQQRHRRRAHIGPRTVKQHLRTLFLRAGIKQGRKRVILATAIFEKQQMNCVATRTVDLPEIKVNHVGMAGAD